MLRESLVPIVTLALAAAPPVVSQIVVEELEEQQPAPATNLQALEGEARQAYAAGDLALAAGLYRSLIDRVAPDRDGPRLRQTLAFILFELGDSPSARSELEVALYAQPELPFRAELYPEAFVILRSEALENARRQRRVRVASLLGEATRAIEVKRFDEALAKLTEALNLSPNLPDLLYNRALAEQGLGQLERAEATFREVLALPGTQPTLRVLALNNLAILLYSRGDFEQAESFLRGAIRLSDRDESTWFNLGLVLEKQQRLEEALQAYRSARALQPGDPSILLRLGSIHLLRQQWVEAVGVLYEASQIAPEQPEIWYQLGRAQVGLGNQEGAVTSLEKARTLDPGGRAGILVPALLSLTDLYLATQNIRQSVQTAAEAVQWSPDSPEAWNALGLARLKAGDPIAAELAFDRATQLAPTRAEFWTNLGTARLGARNYEAAEAAFLQVLKLRPQDAEAIRVIRELDSRRTAATKAPASAAPPELGAALSRADYPQLNVKGLRVEGVTEGSPAQRAGLRPGDLVLRVDGENPTSPQELERLWRKKRSGYLRLSVLREGRPMELQLSAP